MNNYLRALVVIGVLAAGLGSWACGQQGEDPASAPTTPPVDVLVDDEPEAPFSGDPAEATPMLDLGPMSLDLEAKTLTFPAEVILREGMLELLVAYDCYKNHESILRTSVRPSVIHAGLLALGLMPGMPAEAMIFPDRTMKAIPPRGQRLKMTIRWTDEEGNAQETDPSVWFKSAGEGAQLPTEWVFVGSQIVPTGEYWANASGDLISVSNFGSSVMDVPFESSNLNANLIFSADTALIPPLGTRVEVTISPVSNPAQEAYATQYVYVASTGLTEVDGQWMTLDELGDWAYAFVGKHLHARVVMMIDPYTLSDTAGQVYDTLRSNAILDVREVRMFHMGPSLPLTDAQAQAALAKLADRFEYPDDYIEDPVDVAQEILTEIDERQAELERQITLLEAYRANVLSVSDGGDPIE
jgi:hypothetical protein